jgi:hypothetical protein
MAPSISSFTGTARSTCYVPRVDAAVAGSTCGSFADHAEWAGAIAVEHRYIDEIVRGARADGLQVR